VTVGVQRRGTPGTWAGGASWAFGAFVILGVMAWLPTAGVGGAVRLVPIAALVSIVASARSTSVALITAAACGVVAWLVAGLSPALVAPWHWAELHAGVASGFRHLFAARVEPDAIQAWPRAVATVTVAVAWLGAAAAARRRTVTGARTIAVLCLIAPVVLSVLARKSSDQAWLGTAAVLLALAWYRPSRVGRGHGAAIAATAAVVVMAVVGTAGPRHAWFDSADAASSEIRTFDPAQSYGPLTGERDGTTMLRVRARQPAYWRVRVLSRFDGRGWTVSPQRETRLPQPSARTREIDVEVRALRSRGIVSPGEVVGVATRGSTSRLDGDYVVLHSSPGLGAHYRVRAAVVRASRVTLAAAPPPRNPALSRYTTVPVAGRPVQVPLFGSRDAPVVDALLAGSPYPRTLALTQRLTTGARSELEVVARVERFLKHRYRYETNVRDGPRPLDSFLFGRHTGYCQHFSGAAALLLRLSGVPARVVTGFAPGRYDGNHHAWQVRDVDAHSWVEVYFEGVGWTAVDPTPGSAPASASPATNTLGGRTETAARSQVRATSAAGCSAASCRTASTTSTGAIWWAAAAALLLAVAFAWARIRVRRRRRRHPDERAAVLLRALAGGGTPLARGATYADLGDALTRSCGPETARVAWVLEQRRFSVAAGTGPAVRLRTLWRALRRDRGYVGGSLLAARAAWRRQDG
jgi:protein-glutamine gamma-glutamyltransferase